LLNIKQIVILLYVLNNAVNIVKYRLVIDEQLKTMKLVKNKNLGYWIITAIMLVYSIPLISLVSLYEFFGFKMAEDVYDIKTGKRSLTWWLYSDAKKVAVFSSIISTFVYFLVYIYLNSNTGK